MDINVYEMDILFRKWEFVLQKWEFVFRTYKFVLWKLRVSFSKMKVYVVKMGVCVTKTGLCFCENGVWSYVGLCVWKKNNQFHNANSYKNKLPFSIKKLSSSKKKFPFLQNKLSFSKISMSLWRFHSIDRSSRTNSFRLSLYWKAISIITVVLMKFLYEAGYEISY